MYVPANLLRSLLTAVALFASLGVASATFIVIDDFEDLALGPIDGVNDWRAPSEESTVALDPASGDNQVLSVVTNSTYVRHPALILDDTVRMMFLRFRYGEQLNFSLGTSGSEFPNQFGDFETELSMTNSSSELRINDDGNYDVLTVLEPHTWYNCWLMVDNEEEGTSVWLHDRDGEAATAADQLAIDDRTFFTFRSGAAGDLRTFFIKTGGGEGLIGPLYIDDLYLENTSALNLENPTAAITAVRTTPTVVLGLEAYPNPFNPQTQISFTLAETQHVTLAIHGVAGRLVDVLAARDYEAGQHVVTWRGRDTSGRVLPSGTYFAHLVTPGEARTVKLTLLQ